MAFSFSWSLNVQERLKRRNILGCPDHYAAQNSKYARPPIPSQPPTQKVFFQWHTQYDGVNFDFEVKFDLEGQSQSPLKTIGSLIKVFYIYGPNLVILA